MSQKSEKEQLQGLSKGLCKQICTWKKRRELLRESKCSTRKDPKSRHTQSQQKLAGCGSLNKWTTNPLCLTLDLSLPLDLFVLLGFPWTSLLQPLCKLPMVSWRHHVLDGVPLQIASVRLLGDAHCAWGCRLFPARYTLPPDWDEDGDY